MLSDDDKRQIEVLLTRHEEGFAARQELMIHEKVSRELKELEEAKRGRLQFLTAIGGAGILTIAILAWEAISSKAADSAAEAASTAVIEEKTKLAVLVGEMEQHSKAAEDAVRQAEAAESNVNERLKLVKDQLLEIDQALGEIRSAEGRVSYLNEMVELRTSLAGIEASLDNLKQVSAPLNVPTTANEQTVGDYLNQQKGQE